MAGWPIQACFWLEWGSSTAGLTVRAALLRSAMSSERTRGPSTRTWGSFASSSLGMTDAGTVGGADARKVLRLGCGLVCRILAQDDRGSNQQLAISERRHIARPLRQTQGAGAPGFSRKMERLGTSK